MNSDVKLHVQTLGSESNPALLLIHGFMEDQSMWEAFTPLLSEKNFVILIDLPGHGKSNLDDLQVPSVRLIADQVYETIRSFSFDKVAIIGHSLGGYVGLELMKKPTLFSHLTLLHSQPWADSEEKKKDRERVAEFVNTKSDLFIQEAIPHLFAHPNLHSKAIQHYIHLAKKMNPNAIAWTTLAMRNRANLEQLMQDFPHKFTCIQGEKDALIPKIKMKPFTLENKIEYIEIQDCGHMSHEENPTELKAIFTKKGD